MSPNRKNYFGIIEEVDDDLVYLENFKIKQINYQFVKYLADILKQLFPDKLRKTDLRKQFCFFRAV